MKKYDLTRLSTACAVVFTLACACTQSAKTPATNLSAANDGAAAASPNDTVVATVGGKSITLAELDEHIAGQLRELDEQRYEARRQGLDQMVNKQLVQAEAAKTNRSEEQYLKAEVEAQVPAPSEEKIKQFFTQNAKELPPNAKLADYRERIIAFMTRQAHSERAKEVFKNLRQNAQVVLSLAAPPKPRFVVEPKGPTRGASNARVTIVEFSDFQCPFCGRAKETVDKVMLKYGDRARLVFRQFPLSFHNHARKAAEAGLCAQAQDKFWPMHDAMFADQSQLDVPQLKSLATKLGLNSTQFANCLDKGEMAKQVEEDIAAGEKLGVSGTPAFFVNGLMMSGAQPEDEFGKVIDTELARAQ